MNHNLMKVLINHADYIPLRKEVVSEDEARFDDEQGKIKPGYARVFENYVEKYVRYECTDDDAVATNLKIGFDLLGVVKKIHFWVKLWSIVLLVLIVVNLIIWLL